MASRSAPLATPTTARAVALASSLSLSLPLDFSNVVLCGSFPVGFWGFWQKISHFSSLLCGKRLESSILGTCLASLVPRFLGPDVDPDKNYLAPCNFSSCVCAFVFFLFPFFFNFHGFGMRCFDSWFGECLIFLGFSSRDLPILLSVASLSKIRPFPSRRSVIGSTEGRARNFFSVILFYSFSFADLERGTLYLLNWVNP